MQVPTVQYSLLLLNNQQGQIRITLSLVWSGLVHCRLRYIRECGAIPTVQPRKTEMPRRKRRPTTLSTAANDRGELWHEGNPEQLT